MRNYQASMKNGDVFSYDSVGIFRFVFFSLVDFENPPHQF